MNDIPAGRPVTLHPTAFVAPGAVVVGDVTLGERSSVWFNTVVRGDVAPISVGEETNLQDNSTVHVDEGFPTRIGARVTVGHRSIVHGCTIEDDCLIGMGSVLLSGCRIGAGSLVGAASLVREGQVVPPGSLVLGSPARVVGEVNESHVAAIRRGSVTYAGLAMAWMKRGLARPADPWGMVARDRGPMSRQEWNAHVSELARSPGWVEARSAGLRASAWRRAEARPNAAEILLQMRDEDRRLRGPCLERLLRGEEGLVLEPPGAGEGREGEPAAMLEEWRGERTLLVRALAPLGPGHWWRIAGHPTRGPFNLGELVREWVDEDLDRRGRMDEALGSRGLHPVPEPGE